MDICSSTVKRMYGMGRGMNLNILDDSPSLSSRHSPDFKCLAWYPLLQAGCVKDFFQVDRVLAFTLAFISSLLYVILPLGTKEFEKKAELGPCMQRDGEIAVVEYRRSCQK